MFAHNGLHQFDGLSENLIARGVAVFIIVLFKVVDVINHDGDLEAVVCRIFEDVIEKFIKITTVPCASEFIFVGHEFKVFDFVLEGYPVS